ncbi:iojap-like protein [Pirellula staleyi DSM 6068]|uniref:Ribosomal silencing factor RsfS n=1 Tax=Pirellula staleyi (strain ATCC 27377 / DSM 6068 / ICPB 4128) TaxID=530564 RepID=D2R8D5_PIRSD|nr:ribosome silencing factor [Pirellula staleyi]ADB15752.1 iojap-like protein [Pirellula staleyi DSM 6068]
MASTAENPTTKRDPELSLKLAVAAAIAAEENRGQDVAVLDMREQTVIFDFFVIATGTSQRQLRAMGDAVDDVLQKEYHHKRYGTEGYQDTQWILLDYGSVVIHLFDEQHRGFYRLEDLWAGAKRIDYKKIAAGK